MADYVVYSGSLEQYLSCLASDAGAVQVVQFTPGISVTQGTIVIRNPEPLPGTPYDVWTPPANGWWIALANSFCRILCPGEAVWTGCISARGHQHHFRVSRVPHAGSGLLRAIRIEIGALESTGTQG